jgi:phosphoesterase RecJ-like protein
MATCIYTAILSDTGTFTFPGTTSETFAVAHDLTLKGANPALIARDIYFSHRLSKMRLLGVALANLQFSDSLAWTWVTSQDLAHSSADAEDCEGVINYLIAIDGAEAAAFLRETPDGQFRLSIRSKGKINVASVAEALGGGGHRNASGCTLDGPLSHAVACVLTQLRTQL